MKMVKKCLVMFLTAALLISLAAVPGAAAVKTVGTGTVSSEAGVLTNYGGERTDVMLIGGRYTVGAYDIRLTSLGYLFCSGNGNVTINVYNADDKSLVATATTDSSQGTAGQVLYADLTAPVVLSAGKSYFVLMESNGAWKETVGVAANTDLIACTGRCFYDGTNFIIPEEMIYNYGGVTLQFDMEYNPYVAGEQEMITASEICTANGSGVWSDFGSYIGMTVTIGSDDIAVTAIGRMTFTGNSQAHNLRIVDAATKKVLVTVPVNMTEGTAGSYLYADLPYVVTLGAGKTYYVLSEEHAGGDISGTGDYFNTAITDAVAKDGGDNFLLYGCYYIDGTYTEVPATGASRSWVGMNLKYGQPAEAPVSADVTSTTEPTATEAAESTDTSPSTGDAGFPGYLLLFGVILASAAGIVQTLEHCRKTAENK